MRELIHLAILAAFIVSVSAGGVQLSSGTTPHLKHIFIGRCWRYQTLSAQNNNAALKTNVNCDKLWKTFYNSFAHIDPCKITPSHYLQFFAMASGDLPITNALFWSGAMRLVHAFTHINDQHVVLEDTFTGYLMNELNWCGSLTSADGLNYTSCACNAAYPAWRVASKKFAERASGTAHVLLNASRGENKLAYLSTSTFRSVEVPNLKINKLIAYVATSIGKPVRERCGSKSLLELKQDMKKTNTEFMCIDQPGLVLQVYCLRVPHAPECVVNKPPSKISLQGSASETRTWKIIALCFCGAFLLALVSFTIWHLHKRKQKSTRFLLQNNNSMSRDTLKSMADAKALWRIACISLIAFTLTAALLVGLRVARRHVKNKRLMLRQFSTDSRKPMINATSMLKESIDNHPVMI